MIDEFKKSNFNLLLKGNFKKEDIRTKLIPTMFKLPLILAEKKEVIVAKKKAEAERKNMTFYDDTLLRLERYTIDKGFLTLFIKPTTWFDYVASNRSLDENILENKTLRSYVLECSEEILANPITITVVLITSDKKVLLCKRSKKLYQYPGKISASSSGFMSINDKLNNAPNPFETALREIGEELGINIDPQSLVLTGIGRSCEYMHFQILMKAKVKMTMEELLNVVKPSEEIENFVVLDSNDISISAFLLENPVDDWVPAGLAAVLLAVEENK